MNFYCRIQGVLKRLKLALLFFLTVLGNANLKIVQWPHSVKSIIIFLNYRTTPMHLICHDQDILLISCTCTQDRKSCAIIICYETVRSHGTQNVSHAWDHMHSWSWDQYGLVDESMCWKNFDKAILPLIFKNLHIFLFLWFLGRVSYN